MSTSIASTLMEIITTAQNELGKMGHATGSTPGKKGKIAKSAKVSSRKGRSTANSDFTKKIYSEHKPEMDAFIAARVAKAAAGELLYTAEQPSVKSGAHSAGDAYTEKEAAKGAQMIFASFYKSQHEDEWKTFQTAWNIAHPKDSTSVESESESVASGGNEVASVAASDKPKRTISDEQKAKMKAGREAAAAKKKAAKEAEEQTMKDAIPMAAPDVPVPVVSEPAPVVAAPVVKKAPKQAKKAVAEPVVAPAPAPTPAPAPVAVATPVAEAEEEGDEHLPFKYGGANYLRVGTRRADGNHIWATGDLWASNKGLRGKYIGCLTDDGKSIDRTATEPELE